MCLIVVCVVVAIADGVIEEEPADQYREPEPEGQYHDQDFPESFANDKFNLIL